MSHILSAVVSSGNLNGALHDLLVLVVVGIVLGIIYYLVSIAPFIIGIFKTVLLWLIIGFGALILINFLLSLVGHPIIEV